MEPISAALLAALAAGVATSAGKVGENLLVDAYTALKEAIKKKFGGESDVAKAVDAAEAKPDSNGRKETLKEELAAAKAAEDPELEQLANALQNRVSALSSGAQIMGAETAGIVDARNANFSGSQGARLTGVHVGDVTEKPKSEDKK